MTKKWYRIYDDNQTWTCTVFKRYMFCSHSLKKKQYCSLSCYQSSVYETHTLDYVWCLSVFIQNSCDGKVESIFYSFSECASPNNFTWHDTKTGVRTGWVIKSRMLFEWVWCTRCLTHTLPHSCFKWSLSLLPKNCVCSFCLVQSLCMLVESWRLSGWRRRKKNTTLKTTHYSISFFFDISFSFHSLWLVCVALSWCVNFYVLLFFFPFASRTQSEHHTHSFSFLAIFFFIGIDKHTYQHVIISILFCYGYSYWMQPLSIASICVQCWHRIRREEKKTRAKWVKIHMLLGKTCDTNNNLW